MLFFRELFTGAQDKYIIMAPGHTIKRENDQIRGHVYRSHRVSDRHLGIYPAYQKDGYDFCNFACLDFDLSADDYGQKIQEHINVLGLPALVTLSKNNNVHVWFFFKEPELVSDVRSVLIRVLDAFETVPERCTIFPTGDNAILLPFNGDKCRGLGEDGVAYGAASFVRYANRKLTDVLTIMKCLL